MCLDAKQTSEMSVTSVTTADLCCGMNFFTFNILKIRDQVCSKIILLFCFWHVLILLEHISVLCTIYFILPSSNEAESYQLKYKWNEAVREQNSIDSYNNTKGN